MAKELEIREAHVPENIEDVKELLSFASLDELKEFHSRATAAEVFARTKKNREMYLLAGEAKLWSERRVGQIRRELPSWIQHLRFDREEAKRLREEGFSLREVGKKLGVDPSAIQKAEARGWVSKSESKEMTVAELDDEFGVARSVGYRWQQIAGIPEERFANLIEEAKKSEGALTAYGILGREGKLFRKRIETGIYQVRGGRLVLTWKKGGVTHNKTLPHNNLIKARKKLAELRGDIKEPTIRVGRTVGDGYSFVRRALQTLEKIETSHFHPDGKKKINQAILHLHRAEDELVGASNLVTQGRPPKKP